MVRNIFIIYIILTLTYVFMPLYPQNVNAELLYSEVEENEKFSKEDAEKLMNYVTNIENLLNQAKQEYHNGNQEVALSLATIAYIDNYEFLEFELEQYNEELVEEVEWMMREELRGLISSGAPVHEVEDKIDAILEKMKGIATIIPEFGTIAAMILAVAIVSIIIVTTRSKLNLTSRL